MQSADVRRLKTELTAVRREAEEVREALAAVESEHVRQEAEVEGALGIARAELKRLREAASKGTKKSEAVSAKARGRERESARERVCVLVGWGWDAGVVDADTAATAPAYPACSSLRLVVFPTPFLPRKPACVWVLRSAAVPAAVSAHPWE